MIEANKKMIGLQSFLAQLSKGQENYKLYSDTISINSFIQKHSIPYQEKTHTIKISFYIHTSKRRTYIFEENTHYLKPYRYIDQDSNLGEIEVMLGSSWEFIKVKIEVSHNITTNYEECCRSRGEA